MIRDLSQTLQAILDDPALKPKFPELEKAQILFNRPSEDFKPDKPTVDLFLYDIRENVELRSNEPRVERKNGHAIIHRPPLRVACSYLVTAWPSGPAGEELILQEHRLLSQALQVVSSHPTIPKDFLKNSLVGQEPPLPMMTAHIDGLKNPAEFWTALGNKLRPSFTVTVTIGMEVFEPPEPEHLVFAEKLVVGERASPEELKMIPATREESLRFGIAGRVTNAANAPVEGASVTLVEMGLTTTTDKEGLYRLGLVREGTYTLHAQLKTTLRERSIKVPAPEGENYDMKLG